LGRGISFVAALLLTSLVLGCGSGSGSTSGTSNSTQLRFLQGSPDAPPADFLIDGHTQASSMSFGNVTAYISVQPGSRHVQVIPVNSSAALLNETVSVSSGTSQTVYLTGPASQLKSLTLTDGGTTNTTGDGYVRVLNIATKMGPADVFIVPGGAGLAGASPVATNISFDQDTGYQLVAAGDYQVFVTSPGTVNTFVNTGPLSISSLQNQTIVVRDNVGGGFTFSQLQDQ
jgi:hypothetical protein